MLTIEELFARVERLELDIYTNTLTRHRIVMAKREVGGRLPMAVHFYDFNRSPNPLGRVYRSVGDGEVKVLIFSAQITEEEVREMLSIFCANFVFD